jgi:hypothetical protein
MTSTALPITSAGHFSPFDPLTLYASGIELQIEGDGSPSNMPSKH